MKKSSRRILVSLFVAAMSLAGTVQPSHSAEEPAKAPSETPVEHKGGFGSRAGKSGMFELPEGVEPVLAWTPVPRPRVLPTGPVEGGLITEGLQITIRPEKDQVEVMEPIILHITIKNTTDKEIGDIRSPRNGVKVTDEKGIAMPLTRHAAYMISQLGSFLIVVDDRLKGGEERQYKLLVNQTFDMTLSGSYFITAQSNINKLEAPVTISSNTVQIDVFPHGLLPIPTQ